jgi:hypothetical protein
MSLKDWGSEFVMSEHGLSGAWWFETIGNTQQVSKAAEIIFTEILSEEDVEPRSNHGLMCPHTVIINETMKVLSYQGIPTLASDSQLDNQLDYAGGPVTSASLIGAVYIVPKNDLYRAVALITSTGMVRVTIGIISEHAIKGFNYDGDDIRGLQAKVAAGFLRALGGDSFSDCFHQEPCEKNGPAVLTWGRMGERAVIYLPKDTSKQLAMRFPLFGDRRYRQGLRIGRRSQKFGEELLIQSGEQKIMMPLE